MNKKPNPPKKDIYSYLAVLLCFALFVRHRLEQNRKP